MKINKLPSFLIVSSQLRYVPQTGEIFNKITGKVATVKWGKYLACKVEGKFYTAHRLIWLLMTGIEPPELVDHEDRNKQNNKWSNLRLATSKQNCENRGLNSNNALGIKGVRKHKSCDKYEARIASNGVRMSLGLFDTIEEAIAARTAAEEKHFTFGTYQCASTQ